MVYRIARRQRIDRHSGSVILYRTPCRAPCGAFVILSVRQSRGRETKIRRIHAPTAHFTNNRGKTGDPCGRFVNRPYGHERCPVSPRYPKPSPAGKGDRLRWMRRAIYALHKRRSPHPSRLTACRLDVLLAKLDRCLQQGSPLEKATAVGRGLAPAASPTQGIFCFLGQSRTPVPTIT